MKENPYNRQTHYTKPDKAKKSDQKKKPDEKEKPEKDFLSLRSIASEVYPNLSEVTAYRKTLDTFKEACKLLRKDLSEYRQGRDYRIPKNLKSAFIFLLRHINVYKTGLPFHHQDYDAIFELANDFIETKDLLTQAMVDHTQKFDFDDYANFYDMFYGAIDMQPLLLHAYKIKILQEIERDFRYLVKNIPPGRIITYGEYYVEEVLKQIKKSGNYFRNMKEHKAWE